MERAGEHPIPVGPLAVRWLAYEVDEPRAASQKARCDSRTRARRPALHGREGVQLSYHWLDPLGNAIVWDGPRTAFPYVVEPGGTVELDVAIVAPRPPGSYRLAFDLVEELRFWFEEVGSAPLDLLLEVTPRISERRLGVQMLGAPDRETEAALQPGGTTRHRRCGCGCALGRGCHPGTRLVAARARCPSGGVTRLSVERSSQGPVAIGDVLLLGTWGRTQPRFDRPLLLPSVLGEIEVDEHEGLPAYDGADGLFEGHAVIRLRSLSGRPSG
jgi:hypothetical protein